MNKTVLLTGGAGFVGHHTVEHILKNTDWNIIILDRLSYAGNLNRLTDIDVWFDSQDRVKFFYHDFRSEFTKDKIDQLIGIFGNINYIIHMGGETSVDKSIEDPYPFVYSNIIGTVNMLELCRQLYQDYDIIEKYIQIGTDESYGDINLELEPNGHKEGDPHRPSNAYSASKAAAEDFCFAYYRTHNLPIVLTNTMNIIGERQDPEKFLPKVVNSLIDKNPLTLHCKIDNQDNIVDITSRFWLHARNQADGVLFLLKNGAPGEQYNIVGEYKTVYEIYKIVSYILGETTSVIFKDFHSFRPGHDMHYGLDGSKMKLMGWSPSFDFEESLEKTVKWMVDNPKWL